MTTLFEISLLKNVNRYLFIGSQFVYIDRSEREGQVNSLPHLQIEKASTAKKLYFYFEDRNEMAYINEINSIKGTVVEYSWKRCASG